MENNTKLNILFLGTHGQDNIGDELLLNTFLIHYRGYAKSFYVNSYKPKKTSQQFSEYNIKTFHTTKSPLLLLWYLAKSDVVFFGGGSIIKNLYTEYGGGKYETLKKIDTITKVAGLFGKKIVMSNIGVGPLDLDDPLTVKLAKNILSRCNFVSVRDNKSFEICKKLNLKNELYSSNDIVFSLNKGDLVNKIEVKNLDSQKEYVVALNLCRNIDKNYLWNTYIDELIEFFNALSATTGKKIKITGVPMQSIDTETDDYNTLKDFFNKLDSAKFVTSVDKLEDYEDVIKVLEKSNLYVGERLHAAILALVINKPSIIMAYDTKVTDVTDSINASDLCIRIDEQFSHQKLLDVYNLVKDGINLDLRNVRENLEKNKSKIIEIIS